MIWNKIGQIFCADNNTDWMCSRAFLPTPILLSEDIIRIYATFLDEQFIGRVGYVDVCARDPNKIIKISDKPVLIEGLPGSFDDSGVTASFVMKNGDELLMYYQGWQRLQMAPYNIFTGVAVSKDGGETFHRTQNCPILDRIESQLNIRSAPFVLKEEDKWMMWTCSGSGYQAISSKNLPVYGISLSKGKCFDKFPEEPLWCIYPDKNQNDIHGYARPWVIKKNNYYLIWYAERSASRIYRIKFSISQNGYIWTEMDDRLSPQPSESGWDSEMMAFSAVIETRYGTYMFYNGNGYGSTGFGYARLGKTLDAFVEQIECGR
jgi:hypothetical protein